MDCVILSDTHGRHKQVEVPPGDVFIFCGDWTYDRSRADTVDFLEWVAQLPHKHKVIIAGNHDPLPSNQPEEFRAMLPSGIHYLQDEEVTLDGVHFYGMPWTPVWGDWAFQLGRGPRMRTKTDLIPEETDVLITHGPPAYICDITCRQINAGCDDTKEAVDRVQPILHCFGHIHESSGVYVHTPTAFVNAAICGKHLDGPLNQPKAVTIEENQDGHYRVSRIYNPKQ
jgi:Icc-related predicted phosphoesterase